MTEPDAELFDAIRRDHHVGKHLPGAPAERHGVDRRTVMEAITAVPPMELDIPADEEELTEARRCLAMLLEDGQAKAPEQRRGAFEPYRELTWRTGRYRWVWQHITDHRAQQDGTTGAGPVPHERTCAYAAGLDKAHFVAGLITDAVRDLATWPSTGRCRPRTEPKRSRNGAELGLAGLGAARARLDQTLNELALTGLISGLTPARMSAFTCPEDGLVQRVEDYHRLMTT